MTPSPPVRVLMVCTGNICRSPTAEAVLRAQASARGWGEDRLVVDSAGIEAYHVGAAPDPRSQDHAARRGYALGALRARQVRAGDFDTFDWLLAMDRWHLAALRRRCPPARQGRLRLLMDFAAEQHGREVPDPYYGQAAAFEQVLHMVEAGCAGLLDRLAGYSTK